MIPWNEISMVGILALLLVQIVPKLLEKVGRGDMNVIMPSDKDDPSESHQRQEMRRLHDSLTEQGVRLARAEKDISEIASQLRELNVAMSALQVTCAEIRTSINGLNGLNGQS